MLGSEIAVHADDSSFLAYGGTVTRGLDRFDVTPAVDAGRALAVASDHVAAQVAAPVALRPRRASRRLAIQPRDGGGALLVWQVELLVDGQAEVPPGRWFVLVDAASGEVVEAYDGLTTAEQASGPGGNPKPPHASTAAGATPAAARPATAAPTSRSASSGYQRPSDTRPMKS